MINLSEVVLKDFRLQRVLVIGDLMLDRYIRGTASRLSPEAPVPVLLSSYRHDTLGGAANVARNVVALGGECELAGFIGDDEGGERLTEICREVGIGTSSITIRAEGSTTVKTRILSGNHQLLRIDDEFVGKRPAEAYDFLAKSIAEVIAAKKPDIIVVSDYAKGVVTLELMQKLGEVAGPLGIPICVDPKGTDFRKYVGATIIKPNRAEMFDFARYWGWPTDDLISAAGSLRKEAGLTHVMLTLGDQGVALVSESSVEHIPTRAREVFDVTGAGDTVMAAFVLAKAAGVSPELAVDIANHAAAIAIARVGSTAVSGTELSQVLRAEQSSPSSRKVYDIQTIGRVVDQWKAEGKKIVFTNGCFDLLHAGHTSLLQDARDLGDRLVVGLNSDSSITRLKGPKRPLMPLEMRTAVLGALEAIDAIVVFEEDTPLEVIKAVKPDIIVKGGDYVRDTVVGADIVESHGGRVAIIPITANISSSKLAEALEKL